MGTRVRASYAFASSIHTPTHLRFTGSGLPLLPRMEDFLKMDIFFVVTSVAVVVITVLLAMVLIRLLKILKTVDEVSEIVQEETEEIRDDIREVRAQVKIKAVEAGKLLGLVGGLAKPKRRKKSSS